MNIKDNIYYGTSCRSYRKMKLELMENDPHCYYCKIEVVDYGQIPPRERQPEDMATVDHLVSKFYRKSGQVVPKVLACQACNNKRAKEEQKIFPHGRL